jgi:hypothetical protein
MARWAMAAAAGLKPMRGEDRGGSLAVPCGFGNVGFITFDQLSVPGEKGSLHTDRVVPKRPPQRVSCADSSVLLRRGQAVNAGRVHGPEVGAHPGAGAMARQSLDDCAASMTQAMLSSRATRRRRADSGSGVHGSGVRGSARRAPPRCLHRRAFAGALRVCAGRRRAGPCHRRGLVETEGSTFRSGSVS